MILMIHKNYIIYHSLIHVLNNLNYKYNLIHHIVLNFFLVNQIDLHRIVNYLVLIKIHIRDQLLIFLALLNLYFLFLPFLLLFLLFSSIFLILTFFLLLFVFYLFPPLLKKYIYLFLLILLQIFLIFFHFHLLPLYNLINFHYFLVNL